MCKNNDHHLTHEPSNKIVKPTQPGPGTMAKAQSKFPLFSVHNSCISMVTLDPLRVQRAKFFFDFIYSSRFCSLCLKDFLRHLKLETANP